MKFKIVVMDDLDKYELCLLSKSENGSLMSGWNVGRPRDSILFDTFWEAYSVFDRVQCWDFPLKIVMVHVVTTAK